VSVHGFHVGTADLQSAGPITFGPGGSLFLADTRAAKIKALDVADLGGERSLGLFITERLVRSHGGHLVDVGPSADLGGAAVRMLLPAD